MTQALCLKLKWTFTPVPRCTRAPAGFSSYHMGLESVAKQECA